MHQSAVLKCCLSKHYHKACSHDVKSAMLVSKTSPVEVELFSYVNAFFAGYVSKTLYTCAVHFLVVWDFYMKTFNIQLRENILGTLRFGLVSRVGRQGFDTLLYISHSICVFPNSRSQTFSNVKSGLNRCPSWISSGFKMRFLELINNS